MRYPQFFATKAIEDAIGKGVKKGVIWHTQGSGKLPCLILISGTLQIISRNRKSFLSFIL